MKTFSYYSQIDTVHRMKKEPLRRTNNTHLVSNWHNCTTNLFSNHELLSQHC